MHNNNCDNSFELYARHHAPRDTPASDDARAGGAETVNASASSQSNQSQIDESNPPATISIISDPQLSGRTATAAATTSTNQQRPPSIKFKLNRKRSSAGSDVTDRSDVSGKTINYRMKGRSALTSSFLRRKRIEYAGTNKKITTIFLTFLLHFRTKNTRHYLFCYFVQCKERERERKQLFRCHF